MREWILKELWGENYFEPERLGPRTVLYAVSFSGPLVGLLIDGFQAKARWRSHELFDRLRPLAQRHSCSWIYITDADDAVSVFEWEQPQALDRFSAHCLSVFETSPEHEGGRCRLVLAFHDRRGVIVFAFRPGHSFEISFYGHTERLAEVQECA
jgi:hypothetical protein